MQRTRAACQRPLRCQQGVHDFLRAYYHHKSADWDANKPFRLAGWTADELAKMPTYYIMDLHEDMAATVAQSLRSGEEAGGLNKSGGDVGDDPVAPPAASSA